MTRIAKLDWVLHLIGYYQHPILTWRTKEGLWYYPEQGIAHSIGRPKAFKNERVKDLSRRPSAKDLDRI